MPGGYPEANRLGDRTRRRWFERYLETVLRREVASTADLRRFDALLGMARLLMATTGSELIIFRLAEDLGIDRATAEVYEPWMETTFLVHRLPAWSRKIPSRTVRRPKLRACDTGLASAIIGKGPDALGRLNDPSTGPLLESFVVAELAKQLTWSQTSARLHHLRDRDGLEVDAIVESADGRVIAVEVKSPTIARAQDAAPMGPFVTASIAAAVTSRSASSSTPATGGSRSAIALSVCRSPTSGRDKPRNVGASSRRARTLAA